ncbi:YaiI/YqxD family protein [uncultured Desulfobacter sp.]|uniref:YaiI/YqxD family protein n=1 Tax=uncultured Desulfobacter sp. TaxID=240139 RepID=UPI0029F4BA65|nr:YaiI/YqxD family protein [uncultured Desulfobacter sp.]
MKIWVDADACPAVIKNILFKAAQRTRIQLTLVANQPMHIPRLKWVTLLQVASGFDVADNEIVKRLEIGDLVITSDIPLAAQVLEKRGHALSPRGELYSLDSIRGSLHMREFKESLRACGVDTGGPPPLTAKNRNAFAGHLDKLLSKRSVT